MSEPWYLQPAWWEAIGTTTGAPRAGELPPIPGNPETINLNVRGLTMEEFEGRDEHPTDWMFRTPFAGR